VHTMRLSTIRQNATENGQRDL